MTDESFLPFDLPSVQRKKVSAAFDGVVTALLARRPEADASTQPASAGNRRSSDRLNPILAVSSNVDRAAGSRKPNRS